MLSFLLRSWSSYACCEPDLQSLSQRASLVGIPCAESPYPQLSSSVLVLDELDSGVGGRLGAPVGRLLRKMASSCKAGSSQIMCITHLPQVSVISHQTFPLLNCHRNCQLPQEQLSDRSKGTSIV